MLEWQQPNGWLFTILSSRWQLWPTFPGSVTYLSHRGKQMVCRIISQYVDFFIVDLSSFLIKPWYFVNYAFTNWYLLCTLFWLCDPDLLPCSLYILCTLVSFCSAVVSHLFFTKQSRKIQLGIHFSGYRQEDRQLSLYTRLLWTSFTNI